MCNCRNSFYLELAVALISNILLTINQSFDDIFVNSFCLIVITVGVCRRGHKNEFHIVGRLLKRSRVRGLCSGNSLTVYTYSRRSFKFSPTYTKICMLNSNFSNDLNWRMLGLFAIF